MIFGDYQRGLLKNKLNRKEEGRTFSFLGGRERRAILNYARANDNQNYQVVTWTVGKKSNLDFLTGGSIFMFDVTRGTLSATVNTEMSRSLAGVISIEPAEEKK